MPDIHPHADLPELAYPYALDAVSDADRRAIEHLLEHADEPTADTFRATVRELRDTLASMTAVDAVPAPPSVEAALQRTLDALASEGVAPATEAGPTPGPDRRTRGLRWLAAAAAAVAVIGVGTGIAVYRNQSQASNALTAQQIRTQGDAREQTVPVTGGGTITVDASRALGAAIVSFDAVPAAPADRTYQLWLIPPSGQPRSAGVVAPLPTSSAPLLMRLENASKLAVSVEPSGGSKTPSDTVVVAVPLD